VDKLVKSIVRNCKGRFFTIRFILGLVMIFTIELAMSDSVFDYINDIQISIAPWMAPHIFSNQLFVTLFGFILCYMFADVPFMNRSELYWVLREGRGYWLVGKMGVIIVESILIGVWSALCGALIFIPHLTWDSGWGRVIYTITYSSEVQEEYWRLFNVTSSALIEQYTPIQAELICILLITMVSVCIGITMFMLSIYTRRSVSVIFGLMCASLHYAVGMMPQLMQLFYISPLTWLLVGKLGQKAFASRYYPDMSYCFIAGAVVIVIDIGLVMLRRHNLEYAWYKEE
jgi:hypothetical protein